MVKGDNSYVFTLIYSTLHMQTKQYLDTYVCTLYMLASDMAKSASLSYPKRKYAQATVYRRVVLHTYTNGKSEKFVSIATPGRNS